MFIFVHLLLRCCLFVVLLQLSRLLFDDVGKTMPGGSHTGTYEFIKNKGYVPYDTCQPYLACSAESSEGVRSRQHVVSLRIVRPRASYSFFSPPHVGTSCIMFVGLIVVSFLLTPSLPLSIQFCAHVDTTCTAMNTCKTCDTFGGMVRSTDYI